MTVAAEHGGVNSNLLADETLVDPLSGNADPQRHPGHGRSRLSPAGFGAIRSGP